MSKVHQRTSVTSKEQKGGGQVIGDVVMSITASLVRAGHLGRTWNLEPRSVCGEPLLPYGDGLRQQAHNYLQGQPSHE